MWFKAFSILHRITLFSEKQSFQLKHTTKGIYHFINGQIKNALSKFFKTKVLQQKLRDHTELILGVIGISLGAQIYTLS